MGFIKKNKKAIIISAILLVFIVILIILISNLVNIKTLDLNIETEGNVKITYSPFENDKIVIKKGQVVPVTIKSYPSKNIILANCKYDNKIIDFTNGKIKGISNGETKVYCVSYLKKVISNTIDVEVTE